MLNQVTNETFGPVFLVWLWGTSFAIFQWTRTTHCRQRVPRAPAKGKWISVPIFQRFSACPGSHGDSGPGLSPRCQLAAGQSRISRGDRFLQTSHSKGRSRANTWSKCPPGCVLSSGFWGHFICRDTIWNESGFEAVSRENKNTPAGWARDVKAFFGHNTAHKS